MGQAKQGNQAASDAQKNFFELLAKFDNAMLVTHSDKSTAPHARPMAIAETGEDGSIWFITGADTPKIDELQRDANILAVMQNGRQWLSVAGRAELSRDRAHIHRVWKEPFSVWFDGKDDPNIVLIRLNPTDAEYWDNKGMAGVKYALKTAAAYVSGKELRGTGDVDIHAKVPL